MTADEVLDWVLARLESSCRASLIVLRRDAGCLALRVGSGESAIVAIQVEDSVRPSFAVSYPALKVKRNYRRRVEEVHAEGVLVDGLEWIVAQLAQHGVVRPEFEQG